MELLTRARPASFDMICARGDLGVCLGTVLALQTIAAARRRRLQTECAEAFKLPAGVVSENSMRNIYMRGLLRAVSQIERVHRSGQLNTDQNALAVYPNGDNVSSVRDIAAPINSFDRDNKQYRGNQGTFGTIAPHEESDRIHWEGIDKYKDAPLPVPLSNGIRRATHSYHVGQNNNQIVPSLRRNPIVSNFWVIPTKRAGFSWVVDKSSSSEHSAV